MPEHQEIQDLFNRVLLDFFATYNISAPIVPSYEIVSDIARAYLNLRPDVLEKSSVSIEELNRYNGFTVPPKTLYGTFTVLLNANVISENMKNGRCDWIGTIVHETTHVQDFTEYAKIISAPDYECILSIAQNGMFNLWTEINARAKGYYFVRKYTLGTAMNSKELLSDILCREIPLQRKMLFQNYHATNDGYQQAYFVAHYIGRLYTLQQLYPVDFSDEWVEAHFGVNNWMSDWFFFYKKYPVLTEDSQHFEEMKDILRTNFRGL